MRTTIIHVTFGPHRVSVISESREARDRLCQMFHWMLGSGAGESIAEYDIRCAPDGFAARRRGAGLTAAGSLDVVERWVQYQIIECFIRARDDLVWLHGAAAGLDGQAVVIPGRRGRGKSSLVARLWQRGWTFLTDDILPLDPKTLEAVPFPQTPAVRQEPGRELSEDALASVPKTQVLLGDRVAQTPMPVAAIVLPVSRRNGETDLAPCGPGEATLSMLEGCWNFERLREAAVECLCDLVPRVRTARLTFSDASEATDRLEAWASSIGIQ